MKKLILCIVLAALVSVCSGATVKYYSDYPNNPNPPTNYVVSLETGDKSVGGTPYNFWTLGQMVAWLQLRGLTNGGTSISIITNNILYSTNIITTNLFAVYENITYATNVNLTVTSNANFNNSYTTNLTIVVPGGATNLNLTPKTVMWSDANDAQGSIPNASGVFTNNGTGGIGWSSTFSLTELDALNAYLTNAFVFITNAPYLATDANGQIIAGTGTITNTTTIVQNFSATYITNNTAYITNLYVTTGYVTNLYVTTTVITNLNYVTGKGNTLIITNVGIYGTQTNFNVAASSAVISKADQVLTNAVNAHGVFTNTASGPPSFGLLQNTELANSSITVQGASVSLGGSTLAAGSTPAFGGINFTNLGYGLPTNNVGGAAFVFGGPGTAATLYDTNITAATTLKLFDITACGATAGGIKLYVTCSGGTDRILTFPSGCSGAGYGTPPAITITNAKAAFIDIIYKPGATPVTNVFWSPVY